MGKIRKARIDPKSGGIWLLVGFHDLTASQQRNVLDLLARKEV